MPFAFEGDASGGSGARGYFTAYNPSKTLNPKIDIAATSVDPSKSSRSVSTHSFNGSYGGSAYQIYTPTHAPTRMTIVQRCAWS